ncbi:hypothetical protein AAHC03_01329 [Spirometra sp. Aus1]
MTGTCIYRKIKPLGSLHMRAVLLGYPEEGTPSDNASAGDNFVGGELLSFSRPEEFPLAVHCPTCQEPMSFILQLYCPVNDLKQHRILYFFCCLMTECQKSGLCWRVFRHQQTGSILRTSVDQKSVSDWGFGGDEDSSDGELWCEEGGVDSQEGSAPIEGSIASEPSYANENFRSPFLRQFINVYEEESAVQGELDVGCSFEEWILNYQAEKEFVDEDDNEVCDNDRLSTVFETHLATRGDYGCEAVRYSWCGQPVFAWSPTSDWEPHFTCPRCLGERAFEVQIFSTLNSSLLTRTSPKDMTKCEWPLDMLSVLVFTCKSACWHDSDDSCPLVEEAASGFRMETSPNTEVRKGRDGQPGQLRGNWHRCCQAGAVSLPRQALGNQHADPLVSLKGRRIKSGIFDRPHRADNVPSGALIVPTKSILERLWSSTDGACLFAARNTNRSR